MRRARRTRRNPGLGGQIAIGVVVGVVTSFVSAILIDAWREKRAHASLPQPVAPGADRV